MKNRDIYWRRYKIQETLYMGQCTSVALSAGTLGPHTVLPLSLSLFKTLQNSLLESLSATPLYFPESYWRSEISFLSKVILVLGKNRNRRMPNWGYREAESPGWIDTLPKKKTSSWDMMHEQVHCCNEAANHQLPIAVAFWIIPVVSMREWSSLTQNLMQICCSTHSVIAIVTRYRCSLDGVYHPHWLD